MDLLLNVIMIRYCTWCVGTYFQIKINVYVCVDIILFFKKYINQHSIEVLIMCNYKGVFTSMNL